MLFVSFVSKETPKLALWRLFLGFGVAILFICPAATAFAHRSHAGITEIERSRSGDVLEFTHRVFDHDLGPYLFGVNDDGWEERPADIEKIEHYSRAHFSIFMDAKPIAMDFIGAESEGEFIYIYFTAPAPEGATELSVENSLLTDIKEDQINLVNLTLDSKTQSQYFRYGEPAKTFDLTTDSDD